MDIIFKNVTKKFGAVVALNDVSFEIKSGEFVFLTGKTAAGKSTVVSLILGEYFPDEGEISIDDLPLNKKTKKKKVLSLRRKTGVIFQDFRLLPDKTIAENLLCALQVVGCKDPNWLEKLEKALAKTGLSERADFFPAQLSGGEIQRASLARALIMSPKLILADEPTGNLDPETSWEIMSILDKLNKKGVTVLMATHNFDIVNSLRKRVIKLDEGRLVSDKVKGKYE